MRAVKSWAGRSGRPPETFFCNIHTVVRRPSGEEVVGPVDGSPAGITNAGIVTGAIDSQAATWNWRTGAIVKLHQATGLRNQHRLRLERPGVAVGVATVLESEVQPADLREVYAADAGTPAIASGCCRNRLAPFRASR